MYPIIPLLVLASLSACKSKSCEPGFLEGWDEEFGRGALIAREYRHNGIGENGGGHFTQLLFDGEPVETEGCIVTFDLCKACGDRVGEAAAVGLAAPDPEKGGLVVFQVVDGTLQQHRICPDPSGPGAWHGTRYEAHRCRWSYYDAEQRKIVNLLTEYPSIPRLPLPELNPDERAKIERALDTLRDRPVTWSRKPGHHLETVDENLPEAVTALLPLGGTLAPFIVERLDPARPDEVFWLVLVLTKLQATQAGLPVAVLRAHLAASGDHFQAEGQCEEFLEEVGGWP